MAADHTLTLIFDSDEELQNDSNNNASFQRYSNNSKQPAGLHHESKRLSEIVEDYLDEGGVLSPQDMDERKKKTSF